VTIRGIATLLVCVMTLFTVVGGVVGWAIGVFAPATIKANQFDKVVNFDPVAVGFGIGINLGVMGGVIFSVLLMVVAAANRSRRRSPASGQRGGDSDGSTMSVGESLRSRLSSIAIGGGVGALIGVFCSVLVASFIEGPHSKVVSFAVSILTLTVTGLFVGAVGRRQLLAGPLAGVMVFFWAALLVGPPGILGGVLAILGFSVIGLVTGAFVGASHAVFFPDAE
jgi:hypothetical protein